MPPQALGLAMDVPFMSCRTCCVLRRHRSVLFTAAAQSTVLPLTCSADDCMWSYPGRMHYKLHEQQRPKQKRDQCSVNPKGRLCLRSLQAGSRL